MTAVRNFDTERKYGTDRARGILVGLALSAIFWIPVGVAAFLLFGQK